MNTYFLHTFGCQMNVHDSLRMEETLMSLGMTPVGAPVEADLLLVNTCSVRDKAEHKLMSLLGTFMPLKRANPHVRVVVAGCVAQQEGAALLRKNRAIDLVVGPDNIAELPQLLWEVEQGVSPQVRTVFDVDKPNFLHATRATAQRSPCAYVTVMKGCDERCTFCIVPTTRGPERYRSSDSILQEIKGLVAAGVKEVTLLGQTVNSWHEPAELPLRRTTSNFSALLYRIAETVPELQRLRFTSPHPRHITTELLNAYRDLKLLPSHLHLPVQSGSNAVLRRMLRRYTRESYLESLERLRLARPEITVSTDIIVGFPGESRADFEQTLSLVREARFVAAFVFKYSMRPGTPAVNLDGAIDENEKDARLQELLELVEAQQSHHLQSLVGHKVEVLVEAHSGPQVATGRSQRNEIVHIAHNFLGAVEAGRSIPVGSFQKVTVTKAYRHSLQAKMADQAMVARNDARGLAFQDSTGVDVPPRERGLDEPASGHAAAGDGDVGHAVASDGDVGHAAASDGDVGHAAASDGDVGHAAAGDGDQKNRGFAGSSRIRLPVMVSLLS